MEIQSATRDSQSRLAPGDRQNEKLGTESTLGHRQIGLRLRAAMLHRRQHCGSTLQPWARLRLRTIVFLSTPPIEHTLRT
jgi:hypothetical protein